jgi:PAS domain S-box-containing protein
MVCQHDTLSVVLSILMPHGYLCVSPPGLGWLPVIADALVLLVYFSIPVAFVYFVRNRRDISFAWMLVCLGTFILAGGATFLIEIWNVRHSHYWLSSAIKALAVLASVPTAILLARLVPALRASEDRFRSYFNLRLIGTAITSPTKGWVEINDELCRILGYERKELLRMSWAELTHPDDLAADVAHFNRVLAGEIDGYAMDKRFIRKDGRVIDATISVRCLRQADGAVDYFVALVQDITERKLAEGSLRASEERLRAVLESALDCIVTMDHHGRVVEFNPAAEKTYGCKRDATIGQFLADLIIPPTLRKRHRSGLAHYLSMGESSMLGQRIELTGMRSDHSEFPVEVTIIRLGSQEPPMFTGFIRDITDRKRAEEALRKSEKLFTAFMDHLPGYAWIKDVEGRYVYINETFLQLRNAVGKTDAELWPAEIASTYRANDNQVIQTKNTLQTIEPFPKDPERGCQLVSKFPILDQDGAVVMVGGASVDISDLVQAEKALAAQALRYKTLMEMSTDSIYVLDAEGNLQEANAAFLRQRGYTAAEVKGLNITDWDAQWTPLQLQKRLHKLVGSSAVFETRHHSKDGSLFDVEVSATSVRIGGKDLFFCVTRDITERKKAESALRQLAQASAASRDYIALIGRDFRYRFVNDTYLKARGLHLEDMIGHHMKEIVGQERFEQLGRPQVEACLRGEEVESFEWTDFRSDLRCFLHVKVAPLREPDGTISGAVMSGRDITERKQAEDRLRRSEEKFKTLFGIAPVGISVLDRQRNVIDANPALEKITRLRREELLRGPHPHRTVLNADGTPKLPYEYSSERAMAENRPIHDAEAGIVLDNGEIIWVQVSVAPLALPEASAVVITQDITERKRAEQALRESEERFRELAENINEVFWAWTATPGNARCLYVSPAYATVWGRSCESLYSSPRSWMEALHPQDKERVMEEGAHMDFEKISDWTYRIVRPDQSVRWIRDRIFPVRDGRGAVVRFAGIAQDITESKEAEEQVRKANRHLRTLSRRRIQEQEHERRRLSRELHDQIGQSLTAAKINVEALRATENPALVGRVDETITILDQLLGQVRQISLDLRPPMLDDLGLVPALRSFVAEQGRRASVAVRFSAEHIPEKLDPEIQITCFRIAQEAITNAVRHAKATQLDIALRCTHGKELRLLASDNGVGFDARAKQAQAVDLGVIGIKERAALVGGRAKIISSPRKGTTVDVSLPLKFRGERQARHM